MNANFLVAAMTVFLLFLFHLISGLFLYLFNFIYIFWHNILSSYTTIYTKSDLWWSHIYLFSNCCGVGGGAGWFRYCFYHQIGNCFKAVFFWNFEIFFSPLCVTNKLTPNWNGLRIKDREISILFIQIWLKCDHQRRVMEILPKLIWNFRKWLSIFWRVSEPHWVFEDWPRIQHQMFVLYIIWLCPFPVLDTSQWYWLGFCVWIIRLSSWFI